MAAERLLDRKPVGDSYCFILGTCEGKEDFTEEESVDTVRGLNRFVIAGFEDCLVRFGVFEKGLLGSDFIEAGSEFIEEGSDFSEAGSDFSDAGSDLSDVGSDFK